jgi:hypothetical protein
MKQLQIIIDLSSYSFSKFNEEYLATVDVSRPIIVAEISPGRFSVIDGNHRMERARRLGLEKIGAYKLSPCQHMQFLTTEKGYRAYIEYWNDKLKQMSKAAPIAPPTTDKAKKK